MESVTVVGTKELLEMLSAMSLAATFELSAPQHSLLRIVSSENELLLRLSDDSMSARGRVGVTSGGKFKASVSLKLFMTSVRPLAGSEVVKLTHTGNSLRVESGRFKVDCPVLSMDAPEPFWFESAGEFDVQYGELKNLLLNSAWAVGKKSANDAFSSLHLINDGSLAAVASDVPSFLYSLSQVELQKEWPYDVALDARLCSALSRFPSGDSEKVTIAVNSLSNPGILSISNESFALASRLVESKFPNFAKMLSTDGDFFKVSIERDEMLQAISRLNSVMTSDGAKWLRAELRFSDGECEVTPTTVAFKASDVFDYYDEDGESFEVKLDTGKIEQYLRGLEEGTLLLYIPKVKNIPAHMHGKKTNSYHFVTSQITG